MENIPKLHAVHRLYQYRKSISTKPFAARGKSLVRCPYCLLSVAYCTCEHRKALQSNASFMLIMYDDEVLKPTNSGRLIADLVPNTSAFLWSRTEPDQNMLALLNNPQYQAYLVFPSDYAFTEQKVIHQISERDGNKKPLFVLLDGSWRQAVKMFRKSPYLHKLPMLSFDESLVARYALRKGKRDFQLGTAEVAALVLEALGEQKNAAAFNAWFDLFIDSSLLGRNRKTQLQANDRQILIAQFNELWDSAHKKVC